MLCRCKTESHELIGFLASCDWSWTKGRFTRASAGVLMQRQRDAANARHYFSPGSNRLMARIGLWLVENQLCRFSCAASLVAGWWLAVAGLFENQASKERINLIDAQHLMFQVHYFKIRWEGNKILYIQLKIIATKPRQNVMRFDSLNILFYPVSCATSCSLVVLFCCF